MADGLVFEVSDPTELGTLSDWIRQIPGASVTRQAGVPSANELGLQDFLEVLAGTSAALVAVLKVLPEFIKSRRSNVSVKIKVADEEYSVDATNVEDVLPVVERLLDGRRPGS